MNNKAKGSNITNKKYKGLHHIGPDHRAYAAEDGIQRPNDAENHYGEDEFIPTRVPGQHHGKTYGRHEQPRPELLPLPLARRRRRHPALSRSLLLAPLTVAVPP